MRFSEVVGHKNIKERLIRSVAENHVSHAQLFLGPEGSGNFPLAIAFAQYIQCTDKQESDSCGACPSCKQMAKLGHPDVHFSFPYALHKEENSSEHMQEFLSMVRKNYYLRYSDWMEGMNWVSKKAQIGKHESDYIGKRLSLKSFLGGYKILIIWMAETINAAASNKLLKTIEEPPPKTLLILVANSDDSILPTIISRTQLVKLPALSIEETKQGLINHYQISPEAANTAAYLADGNFREALELAENQGEAKAEFSLFASWMRICYKKDVSGAVTWVDEVSPLGREKHKSFVQYSLNVFRECLVGKYSEGQMMRLEGDERKFAGKFAPFITGKNILGLYEEFNTAYTHLDRNANAKILFLDLSFKVMKLLNRR